MNNKIMYDSFELLYVYIKKIDRCFEDTYFSFTNDYDIGYDYGNKRLKIVKKDFSVLTNPPFPPVPVVSVQRHSAPRDLTQYCRC